MNGLLKFATKYFPELEKVAEGGDGCSKDDEFIKMLRSFKTKKEKKSNSQRRPQKKLRRSNNHPRQPPPQRWYPKNNNAMVFPPRMKYPVPFYPRPRPFIKPSKLKTGTVIGNVSTALESFKRKRDKFLVYLQQLQKELTELNLPSLSTEDMTQKRKKRGNREDSQKEKTGSKVRRGTSAQVGSVRSQPNLRKKKVLKKKKRPGHPEQSPKQILDSIINMCSDSSSSTIVDF